VFIRADAEPAVVDVYLWGETRARSGASPEQTMIWGGMLLLELYLVQRQPRLHTHRLQTN
jgi:hypothetical protein